MIICAVHHVSVTRPGVCLPIGENYRLFCSCYLCIQLVLERNGAKTCNHRDKTKWPLEPPPLVFVGKTTPAARYRQTRDHARQLEEALAGGTATASDGGNPGGMKKTKARNSIEPNMPSCDWNPAPSPGKSSQQSRHRPLQCGKHLYSICVGYNVGGAITCAIFVFGERRQPGDEFSSTTGTMTATTTSGDYRRTSDDGSEQPGEQKGTNR